jgi:hypothetical protein
MRAVDPGRFLPEAGALAPFNGMSALALLAIACSFGCTESEAAPGPFSACSVWDWDRVRVGEIEGCTCDPSFVWPPDVERFVVARGTATALVAPPGSFAAGTPLSVTAGGAHGAGFAREDGSVLIGVSGDDFELRGTVAEVVGGGRSFRVALDDAGGRGWFTAERPADTTPPGSLAVEDPAGTIAFRGIYDEGAAGAVRHFALVTDYFGLITNVDWQDHAPRDGEPYEATIPGSAGLAIGWVALHDHPRASGCSFERQTPCGCSPDTVAAGECTVAPPIDVLPPSDPGPPDAGPSDAGEPMPPE